VEEKDRRKIRQNEVKGKAEEKKRMYGWKEKVKPARRKTKKRRWMELNNVEEKGRTWQPRNSAGKRAGKPIQITGTQRSGREHAARIYCICVCLYRWYNSLSVVQINPFSPSQRLPATDSQSFQFRMKIGGSPLLAGPKNFFFVGSRTRCQWLCPGRICLTLTSNVVELEPFVRPLLPER
jgi:hypothetical protein